MAAVWSVSGGSAKIVRIATKVEDLEALRVAMNTWWDDDQTQRYWMQITDRRTRRAATKSEAPSSDMGATIS